MKDIEKLFGKKLKDHQVMPPVEGWEKLNRQLQAKRGRKLFVYWKIAASVCLFMAAIALVYFIQKDKATVSTTKISHVVQPAPLETIRKDSLTTEKLAAKNNKQEVEPKHDLAKHEEPKGKNKVKAVKKPVRKEEKQTLPAHELLADVPRINAKSSQLLEVNEKLAAAPQVQVSRLASHDTYQTVTVIYKAGNSQEKDGSLGKTFAFLNHLKSNAIGFSELRQAKDELITKAFSSGEKEEVGK